MELGKNELDNRETDMSDATELGIHSDARDESKQAVQDDADVKCESITPPEPAFKKPVPIIGPRRGKIGTLRPIEDSKFTKNPTSTSSAEGTDQNSTAELSQTEKKGPNSDQKDQLPLPYREPSWAGIPDHKYQIEILKSGVILDTINLNDKSLFVIGRLPVCDIPLAHPTISRYHAILQYRRVGDDKNGPGFYIYDLESTHGTFWNGSRIKPKHYVKIHGGHMLRFGCSQRKLIFQSPSEEVEAESEYSATELKEIRRLELMRRKEEEEERQQEMEYLERAMKEKEESEGIDWGMGEDADEESDLTENPYACTTNEELFLDDPKKTLRGWFEREGHDMQYQTEEKGIGQFLCWIELPIEATGRSIRAEALVKGKKKESVVQCALEACRILDRQGLLRQATHEGKKRKSRNWAEEDYYDSDEDNFLDRTGTIERKREKRMRNAGKLETKAETHASLVEKHSSVVMRITAIQETLNEHDRVSSTINDNSDEDALDAFMSNLSSALLSKTDMTKMKQQLQHLRKEEERLGKLIDIVKPANLPALNPLQPVETTDKFNEDISLKKKVFSKNSPQVENEHGGERLVPNKGQYGLIKKDGVTIDKMNETSDVHAKELNVNVQIMGTDNDEDVVENQKMDQDKTIDDNTTLKRKKRNIRRMQQRADKVSKEVEKSYDENVYREDYSMWIPPDNQSGDGKTSLNDKLGY